MWTIDHLPVASPGRGAGRHVVGRGLQRSARSVDQAIDYLRARPSAGGFAYSIGDRAGRVVNVEAAAGRHAFVEPGPAEPGPAEPGPAEPGPAEPGPAEVGPAEPGPGSGPLLWHTNHGRYVPGAEPSGPGTSVSRGKTLDALTVPAQDPEPSWFLRVLTSPPPDGVRADPGPALRAATLCTLVADLTAGQAVIAVRDDRPVA